VAADHVVDLHHLALGDLEAHGVRSSLVEHFLHVGGVSVAPGAVILGICPRGLGLGPLLVELLLGAETLVGMTLRNQLGTTCQCHSTTNYST
jgi:hypothetical protein